MRTVRAIIKTNNQAIFAILALQQQAAFRCNICVVSRQYWKQQTCSTVWYRYKHPIWRMRDRKQLATCAYAQRIARWAWGCLMSEYMVAADTWSDEHSVLTILI